MNVDEHWKEFVFKEKEKNTIKIYMNLLKKNWKMIKKYFLKKIKYLICYHFYMKNKSYCY